MEKKKKDFRLRVEEYLKEVPEGRRVHIDKDTLEELIFTTVVYNKDENKSFRLPTWTGPFLEKVDLSEISFEDVAWSMLVADYDEVDSTYIDEDVYDKLMSEDSYVPSGYVVTFSNTNANIDFSQSFEAKVTDSIAIVNCNFSGTDLSRTDLSTLNYASDSDFSKTGLQLPDSNFTMFGCNLSDNDLSKFTEEAIALVGDFVQKSRFRNCMLSNTGINVNLDQDIVLGMDRIQQKDFKDEFMAYLKNGALKHCYINGEMILSNEDRKNGTKNRRDFENSLLNDIKEQIASFKK